MMENHLWNNWRQGNYKKDITWTRHFYGNISHTLRFPSFNSLMDLRPISSILFTDDIVLSVFSNRIEMLDVRKTPPLLACDPISVSIHPSSTIIGAGGNILVLYSTSVQVFSRNICSNQWMLKHSFLFGQPKKLPENKMRQFFRNRILKVHTAIVDNFFVGVKSSKSTLHIWNIDTGVKIKEETCPFENATIEKIVATASKDIILFVKQNSSFLLAYSLSKLIYLPFRKMKDFNDYVIFHNYIAVWNYSELNIYDYRQSHTILSKYSIRKPPPEVFGNSIILLEGMILKLFNPSTSKMQILQFQNYIKWFKVICNRFIVVHHNDRDRIYEIVKVNNNYKVSKILPRPLTSEVCVSVSSTSCNKSATRLIMRDYIFHFW